MSEPIPVVPVISYAMPDVTIRLKPLMHIAWWTGGTPLAVGLLTMLAWLFSGADFLMAIGIWTILIGVPVTAVGFICLLVYFFTNRIPDRDLRRRVNSQSTWAMVLLILNYPAAYGCVMLAISMH